ncbi:hypothetical protein KGP17_15045 [Serratia sp. JSRIV001]|uniref:hypothetical protein n=1 Tax=Serratia sp. JSRIV001 TaxID=2831893 RepID=UPI001CBB0677|nr:hypothetical protein [Serratia sp. JSRIV001]UAN43811.1 hypothetical protein KGP17_15045 [Serratia sp. JSRIV001]
MMKKNIDCLPIFNTILISVVIVCISGITFAIFKYHISGFGTYADFIIALANTIMALAACYGVKSAREWLKEREKEERFNKRQRIISDILKFTFLSSRTVTIITTLEENVNHIEINLLSDNVIKMAEKQFSDLNSAWDRIILEKEAMRILSKGYLDEDIKEYFDLVKIDAAKMTTLAGRFFDLLLWRWGEKDLEYVRKSIILLSAQLTEHNEVVQKAYTKLTTY